MRVVLVAWLGPLTARQNFPPPRSLGCKGVLGHVCSSPDEGNTLEEGQYTMLGVATLFVSLIIYIVFLFLYINSVLMCIERENK